MKTLIVRVIALLALVGFCASSVRAETYGQSYSVMSQVSFQGGSTYGWVWTEVTAPNGTVYKDTVYYPNNTGSGNHSTSFTMDQYGNWTGRQYSKQGAGGSTNLASTWVMTVAQTQGTITVSANPGPGGSPSGGGTYNNGDQPVVYANPASGYVFDNWTEGGSVVSSSQGYQFTVSGNRNLVANYHLLVYWQLATSVTGSGSIGPGTQSYLAGTTVGVSASPSSGWYLASWGGSASPGGNSTSISVLMNQAHTIIANFSQYTYTLSTNSSAGGSVGGGGTYNSNSWANPQAYANYGYYFSGWSGDISGSTNPQGVYMDRSKSVYAQFYPNTYTVSTGVTGSGSVSGGGPYTYTSSAYLQATPGIGYYFTGWSGALTGTTNGQWLYVDGPKSVTATFAPNSYTVSGTVTGSGTISGTGPYTYGQTATLTANPGTGYYFTGWSPGDLSGTTATQNLTVNADKSVTANFAQYSYTLTTTTAGTGSGSVSGGGTYAYGANATATAAAATGSTFAAWSNAATGTTNPVNISMTSNRTLTATFTLNQYTLTTNTAGTGSGSVTAGTTSNYGTTQSITATAATGSTFTGWSGAATGTTNPVTVTIDSNKTLTANFAINTYALTTTTTGSGSGSVTGAGTYNFGATATSTATASTGSNFAGWSNAATGSTNPVGISMTSAKTLTATFNLNNYTLTTSTSGTGTITAGGTYSYGNVRSITATPGTGQSFAGWSGAATGTTNPINITVDSDKTLTATFTTNDYTLTTTTSGIGTTSAGGSYPYGTVRSITATPGTGQSFSGWSGAATGTTNPINITVDADKTLTAAFAPINYTISTAVTPAAGGSVSGSGTYAYGSTASFTATPATGYTFSGFSGAITSAANPSSLTVSGNATVTANFTLNSYTLTTTTTGTGSGSVSGGGAYTYGSTATATATPATGSSFTGWSNAATGTTNPASISMTSAKTLTATFVLNNYTVTTNVSGTGTVSGAGTYNYGQTASLNATPGTGYAFAGWSGAVTGTTNPQPLLVDGNKNVTATFTANNYTLSTTNVGSGSTAGGGPYTYGQTAALTASPAMGWLFAGFSGALTSATSPASLLMDGNKAVTATFVRQTYTLTTSVSGSGSITPGGSYNAPDPSVTAVTIGATPTASTRYTGFTGSTTGTTATANSDGTASLFVPMTSDRSIIANFAAKLTQTITFAPIGTHSVTETFTDLSATASSGLPVSFTVISGPGTLAGSRLTFTGTGTIVVQASQVGSYTYFAATPVQQNASVVAAPVTSLKEDEGESKINDGEKEEGNFRTR